MHTQMQPSLLNRNLCYHREAARNPESSGAHASRLRLELSGAGSSPLSLLAALCHKTAVEVGLD